MVEQPPTVYEVKAILGETIDSDVVFYGLKVRQLYTLEQLDVDIGGNNSAGGPDLLTQPCCHRTAPSTYFQTPRSRANSECCHSPFCHGIKVLLEQIKSAPSSVPGIVECVVSHLAPQKIGGSRSGHAATRHYQARLLAESTSLVTSAQTLSLQQFRISGTQSKLGHRDTDLSGTTHEQDGCFFAKAILSGLSSLNRSESRGASREGVSRRNFGESVLRSRRACRSAPMLGRISWRTCPKASFHSRTIAYCLAFRVSKRRD